MIGSMDKHAHVWAHMQRARDVEQHFRMELIQNNNYQNYRFHTLIELETILSSTLELPYIPVRKMKE